jgi:hypothetical protein
MLELSHKCAKGLLPQTLNTPILKFPLYNHQQKLEKNVYKTNTSYLSDLTLFNKWRGSHGRDRMVIYWYICNQWLSPLKL